MDEYVNRKKLEEAFDNADTDVCESDMDGHSDWGFGRENVRDVIRSVPAADVAPVVHSYWQHIISSDEENIGVCHNCKYPVSWFWGIAKYCPDCGAKMDGGNEHAADCCG